MPTVSSKDNGNFCISFLVFFLFEKKFYSLICVTLLPLSRERDECV